MNGYEAEDRQSDGLRAANIECVRAFQAEYTVEPPTTVRTISISLILSLSTV